MFTISYYGHPQIFRIQGIQPNPSVEANTGESQLALVGNKYLMQGIPSYLWQDNGQDRLQACSARDYYGNTIY